MTLTMCEDDDGRQKLYIVMKADSSDEWYVYQQDYFQDPHAKWVLVGDEDKTNSIALLAEVDDRFKGVDARESRVYHNASLLKQIQKEMIEYLQNGGGELPNNLVQYGKCKNSIAKSFDEICRFNAAQYGPDDIIDYYFFESDWEDTFGNEINKDNDDPGLEK